VAPETAQKIKQAEQGIADFEKGRDQGRAEGSMGLLNALPPVQLVKAVDRIASAEDKEAEALKIAGEKVDTVAGIGKIAADPAGTGMSLGTQFAKSTLKAKKEGRLAESLGNLAGHADVIGATAAA